MKLITEISDRERFEKSVKIHFEHLKKTLLYEHSGNNKD